MHGPSLRATLAGGPRDRVACRDDEAARRLSHPRLEAHDPIRVALGGPERGEVETAWPDPGPLAGDLDRAGGTAFTACREGQSRDDVPRGTGMGGAHARHAVMPLHRLVLGGMLRGIRRAAAASERGGSGAPASPPRRP